MKPIEALREYVQSKYPDAKCQLVEPLRERGFWSLDVDLADKKLAIEWSEDTGFGVSNIDPEGYGERTDESYKTLKEIKRRVDRLLTSDERTSPPFGILLSRLREHRNVTQEQLARALGVKQATISGMERREDVQLSTLWRTVEALGGTLEIYGVFASKRYRIDIHGGAQEALHSSSQEENEYDEIDRSLGLNYMSMFEGLQKSGSLQRATDRANGICCRQTVIEMP
jgi:transcriptional regulator with XRE-family HTH domain